MNNRLEVDKSIDSSLSGTTAVAGVIIGKAGSRKVIMANAGDSRAIVAYEDVRSPLSFLRFSSLFSQKSCNRVIAMSIIYPLLFARSCLISCLCDHFSFLFVCS